MDQKSTNDDSMVTAERARELLSVHGRVQSQLPSDWTGKFPLPDFVERFFQEVGPFDITIEAYGNPFFLPCLSELWDFQAGYRWNGLSGESIDEWDDDWLVVADEGGDPLIVSRQSGRVLHDVHGRGFWQPSELFPDLTSMAACLAELGTVIVSAGDTFTDEDFRIRPTHRKRALAKLQQLLGSSAHAESVLGELGWG